MEIKWFIGKPIWKNEPFAIYKAEFNGEMLMSQKRWGLLPKAPKKWESTNQVSKWYFVGEETVNPCTEAEAAKYLPKEALAK